MEIPYLSPSHQISSAQLRTGVFQYSRGKLPHRLGTFPSSVAITQDRKLAYVTNESTACNSVSVIVTKIHSVIATVSVAIGPAMVAFTPNGKLAYIVHVRSEGGAINLLSVIDTKTHSVSVADGEFV
ncbi:YncE family protein [Cytobacillus sp. Hm23]